MNDRNQVRTYVYDAIDQLTGVGYVTNNLAMRNVAYQYDPVGNRQQVTDSGTGVSPVWYTANNLNQYTMVGGNNLSYDTKGNLQTIPGWTYQYDAQNRLLSVSSASSVVQFSYDARNRCVARTVNGNITRFVYDGWSLLEERNASGVEQARYYHGAMIDELLLRITANTHYYHHDGLGSTIALTDSTGALVESYTYDVFGTTSILSTNLQLLATSAVGNRFLFTGREYLAEIGLYDYRNRFYSQSLGRFLQTDPIGFEAKDVNLYRYVSNNPANYFDPNGTVTHTDTCEKKDDVGKVKTGTDEVKIELSGASNPILNKVKKVYDTFKPDYAPDSDRLQRLASGLLQMLSSVGTPFDLTATAKWTQCVCNAGKYSWENKEVSKKLDTFYFNDPDLGRKMRDAIDNFSEGVFP